MAADDILQRLAALADSLGPALVPPGHDELLRSIAETARALFGAAACSIALLEEERAEPRLVFKAAVGQGADAVLDLTIPASQGLAGFVVRSGQPLVIDDVTTDPRFAASFADETGYVPTSIVAAPLETDRGVLGVLEILDPSSGSVGQARGMELIGHFASLAALALESAGVFRDLGSVLFQAAAKSAGPSDSELAEALGDAARSSRGTDKELAELAWIFLELRRLGPLERQTATTMLMAFFRYAAGAQGTCSQPGLGNSSGRSWTPSPSWGWTGRSHPNGRGAVRPVRG
jgi:transcriptional regulator with GAF, ATPase, and Fis domain